MCEITGFWSKSGNMTFEQLNAIGQHMTDTLTHRGPDSSGIWCAGEQGIFLGHRRLAIQDLTQAGHQPMQSACGRYIIIYNGEVYNAVELQQQLSPHTWQGHSDTEVILQACIEWGVTATVQKLIGMFAFAFYDQRDKQLYLVRDRIGIKPLYWGIHNSTLLFGSELKALVKHPYFIKEINKAALSQFFQLGYITAPQSIWQHTYKLKQGHYLKIDQQLNVEEICFWNLDQVIQKSQQNQFTNYDEYVHEVEILLEDAVRRRLIADVPFGAFLSGGIDSSLVTALMQKASSKSIKTFSIGFHEAEFNEAHYAREVAQHLGTDHHEAYVSQSDALNVIPQLSTMYDEPFADASQIPTYLVSKLARSHVTVALSGDGGDELFAGYNRYLYTNKAWQKVNLIPHALRKMIVPVLQHVPTRLWQVVLKIFMSSYNINNIQTKIKVICNLIRQSDLNTFYNQIISLWPLDNNPVLNQQMSVLHYKDIDLKGISLFQQYDMHSYLPDDILHKVDRASMAASLEARVPLLDHRIIELSWRVPLNFNLDKNITKRPLRDILYKHVPQHLIERPKMGFGVPIAKWLTHDLRDWTRDLLNPENIIQDGLLDNDMIQQRWQQHQNGDYDWQASLWCVVMFQAWKKEWLN